MSGSLVSSRLADIPFAGIRKVFEKAGKLEAQGKKVIHFEIGRPDFDTPAHIKEAAKKALDKGFVHYTPNLGTLDLRQALSESLMTYKNVAYDPLTEIMVTAGGQEAMYLSLMALLEPGDEVLIPDPGLQPVHHLCAACTRDTGPLPPAPGEKLRSRPGSGWNAFERPHPCDHREFASQPDRRSHDPATDRGSLRVCKELSSFPVL